MSEESKNWNKHKIICPYCGAEYLPSEIYVPSAFFGKPSLIIKDDDGKLSDIYNSDLMDLKEEYICDKCNHTFFVEANISFNTSKEHEEEYCDTTTIKIK